MPFPMRLQPATLKRTERTEATLLRSLSSGLMTTVDGRAREDYAAAEAHSKPKRKSRVNCL
jgi:hypothetical protein